MKKIWTFISFLIILHSFVSCGPKLEPKPEGGGNQGQSTGSGDPGGDDPHCDGCAGEVNPNMASSCLSEGISHAVEVNVGGNWVPKDPETAKSANYLIDYFNFPLVLRGKAGGQNEVWSSENASCLKERFKSDATLQVRFLVFPRLTSNTDKDSNGVVCSQQDSVYKFKKMRLKVSLYGVDDTTGVKKFAKQYEIPSSASEGISVGDCSQIYSFNVPSDSDRFVMTIDEIQWDFFCENKDVWSTNAATVCPFTVLPNPQCVKVGIQVATDSTLKLQWESSEPAPKLSGESFPSNQQCP